MKKYLRILLTLVLALCLGLSLVACGDKPTDDPDKDKKSQLAGTYNITVWAAEAATELFRKQIADYNNSEYAKTNEIVINAEVIAKSEADAGTDFINAGVEQGPDLYCFAQDQFARLVQAGGLAKLGQAAAATVSAANDAGVVSAAKSGDQLYAYPMTSDNGYFMYYDKSVINEEHLGSLEDLIADCEAANKFFSFKLEDAWYTASFFFGVGCKSEWVTDDDGAFVSIKDDFNSAKGLIAAKGMRKLLASKCYVNSALGSDFESGSAIVVSGTWDYNAVKGVLGDNFGAAELPSYTVDGQQYHIGSFNGCKLLGVKPQVNAVRSAVCHNLAQFLTDYDRQVERFTTLGWGPANLQAQGLDAVKENAALSALFAQNQYSVPQGQIHGSWWDIAKVIGTEIREGDGSDASLQGALDHYEASIKAIFNMSEDEKNAWSVIGAIAGTNWDTDFDMTEQADGTWKSNQTFELTEGNEFKVRQGKNWDVSYGNGGNNYVVAAAGTYYIVFNPTTTEVTLVPVA